MKRRSIIAALGCAAAIAPSLVVTATPSRAADPEEVSKDIIAVQIRKQGFDCPNALKAERDATAGNPDDQTWVLTCDSATYKVHLIPDMAATVERLSEDNKDATPKP